LARHYSKVSGAGRIASMRSVKSLTVRSYTWCVFAARSGWSVEETEQKLLEVSEKARERAKSGDEGYAHVTAQNAAAAAGQGRRRGRG
jgi:hypothetical protein